jgi:hypothetical protein
MRQQLAGVAPNRKSPAVSAPGDRWEREADRVADDVASRATDLDDLRRRAEERTGADLSAVRLHTDAGADSLNRSQRSLAFTSGADVYFRAGQYSPGTAAGRHVIAHELTHVAQQAAGGAPAVQHVRGLDAVRRAFGPKAAPADSPIAEPREGVLELLERRGVVRALIDSAQVVDELARWTESGIDRKLGAALRAVSGSARGGRQAQLVDHLRDLKLAARDWKAAYAGRQDESPALNLRFAIAEILDFGAKAAQGHYRAQGQYLGAARKTGGKGGLQALSDSGLQAAQNADKDSAHGLTRAEKAAIQIYTTNNYRYINPSIADDAAWLTAQKAGLRDDRAGAASDAALNEEGRLHAGVALSAVSKLPESRVPLWRGMRGSLAAMTELLGRDFAVGTLTTKGITSASRNRGTAGHFMKAVPGANNNSAVKNAAIEITYVNVPSYDISDFSYNSAEEEQIILPGTKLVVGPYERENLAPDDRRFGPLYQLGVRYLFRLRIRAAPTLGRRPDD